MKIVDLRYNAVKEEKDLNRRWLILIGLTVALVLVACNGKNSPNENNNVNDTNENGSVNEENNQNDTNVIENDDQNIDSETDSNNGAENENTNNGNENQTTEEILKEKVYAIFAAQRDSDYDYLTSVLSEGSELDQKNHLFIFNDVTYPHEQEFLDDIAENDLEYRYIHEEDSGSIIVGFAAIDYENESSFVIDFEFVLEGDEWKMNDMEINK